MEKNPTASAECAHLESLMTEQIQLKPALVTSALPYANGPIHLGHLVEYIQTDIWVRFQRMLGRETYYFCADDTHGTAVMLAAKKRGITPEELVSEVHREHYRDLTAFDVRFDHYYTTNSSENRELASAIYLGAKEKGHIARRSVRQLYCEHDQMFLPDRFVKGICPRCGATDQYGDSCEVCGATYTPDALGEPRCAICGSTPVLKEAEHLFFKLGDFQEYLENWMQGRVDEGVRRKMQEWMEQGLQDWDISRDGPYFGFEIPGEKDKYFYVWLDAPVGYMASALNYFRVTGRPELFDRFWRSEETEVYHFIGKDIIYFHTLFWPAMLRAGGFRPPTAVFVHGFLTINGEKMSKSRGTLIRAETYLKYLDPQALRYFYASRLGPDLNDLDLSQGEFLARYNSAVVGNFANLFSRLCTKIAETLDRRLSSGPSEEGRNLCKKLLERKEDILTAYADRNTNKALRIIEGLGDEVNRFIAAREPWKLVKSDIEGARQVMTDALNAGWILSYYLRPVLPVFADGVAELLALPAQWTGLFHDLNINDPLYLPANHVIRPYRHLAARITEAEFQAMLDEERQAAGDAMTEKKDSSEKTEKSNEIAGRTEKTADATVNAGQVRESGLITVDELSRVELRAARIVEASFVDGADKLIRIGLDLGEGRLRSVFAGIRAAYDPSELVGLMVVCVANLTPRKMKSGVSEAMLLASGEGQSLTLYVPHRQAKPGDRLR